MGVKDGRGMMGDGKCKMDDGRCEMDEGANLNIINFVLLFFA